MGRGFRGRGRGGSRGRGRGRGGRGGKRQREDGPSPSAGQETRGPTGKRPRVAGNEQQQPVVEREIKLCLNGFEEPGSDEEPGPQSNAYSQLLFGLTGGHSSNDEEDENDDDDDEEEGDEGIDDEGHDESASDDPNSDAGAGNDNSGGQTLSSQNRTSTTGANARMARPGLDGRGIARQAAPSADDGDSANKRSAVDEDAESVLGSSSEEEVETGVAVSSVKRPEDGVGKGARTLQQPAQDVFSRLFIADPLANVPPATAVAWSSACKSFSPLVSAPPSAPRKGRGMNEDEDEGEPLSLPAALCGAGYGSHPPLEVTALSFSYSGVEGTQCAGWDASPVQAVATALYAAANGGMAAQPAAPSPVGAQTPTPRLVITADLAGRVSASLSRAGKPVLTNGTDSLALLLPPSTDLVGSWCVRPRVDTAWTASYGGEIPALLQAALKTASAGGSGKEGLALVTALKASLSRPHPFSPLQALLWPVLTSHADLLFPARTLSNARELRSVACLHIADHVSRARLAVEANTTALRERSVSARQTRLDAAAAVAVQDGGECKDGGGKQPGKGKGKGPKAAANPGLPTPNPMPRPVHVPVPEARDQGFTRPRALILLPTRHTALAYIRTLLRLLAPDKAQVAQAQAQGVGAGMGLGSDLSGLSSIAVSNRNRLFREFGEKGEEEGVSLSSARDATARKAVDDAEEEEDAAAEGQAKKGGAALSTPAVVRLLAKRRQQMMSDDEGDETPVPSGGEGLSSTSVYVPGLARQGWPAGLLDARRRERSAGAHAPEDGGEEGGAHYVRPFGKAHKPKGEARRRDKAETIGDNIKGHDDVARRMERDAKRAAKSRERAAALSGGKSRMPVDYEATFRGNVDDDFRVGLSLGKKTLHLYSDFYSSDILVASPLGLRRILGGEGDRDKDRDIDFLSSIDIVLVDGSETLLMQNWSHVADIFGLLNSVPRKPRMEIDFARVRESSLAGMAKHTRQTLVFSSFMSPDFSSLIRRSSSNICGGLIAVPSYAGQLGRVVPPVRQVYARIPGVSSLAKADDARFSYFRDRLLPEMLAENALNDGKGNPGGGGGGGPLSAAASHVLIYVPAYFDYVRLRNLLDAKEAEFVTCCEYTDDKDVTRARARFAEGDAPIMLMTERFHFYRRFRMRGIRHILFYAPPNHAHFYPELLNLLMDASSTAQPVSCTVLYTRYDAQAVERLVGSDRAGKLLDDGPGARSTFVFMSAAGGGA